MPLPITVSKVVSGLGAAAKSSIGSYAPDQSNDLSEGINYPAANQEVDFAFPVNTLEVIVLIPSVNCTILTNSTGSPQDTLTLKAGVGLIWTNDSGVACPFSGAVTKLFITNTDSKAGKLIGGAGFGDQI